MAIFKSNVTPDDIFKELENAVEHHEIYMASGDANLANMWKERRDSIVDYCAINAEKLGLL